MFAILAKIAGWLGVGVGLAGTAIKSMGNNLLVPLFNFLINNRLKIVIFGVFGAITLNLTASLIGYVLYHLSVAIHLGLGPYITQFSIGLIVNFIIGIIFLFIGLFIHKLLKN